MKLLIGRIYNAIAWRVRNFLFWLDIKTKKNIFVFGAPYHSNMGDQAQTHCIYTCLKYYYPRHKIRIYDTRVLTSENYHLLHRIKRCINYKDLVFLHSGYHTTDLYLYEENMQRKVIHLFSDKKIVILPQTINYEHKEEEVVAKYVYNKPQVTLMCRDEISYKYAQKLFDKNRLLLFPDIVTTMIGRRKYAFERKGILLCLRNDKESKYTKECIKEILCKLSTTDTVSIADTTIDVDANTIEKNREQILENLWADYAKYRVVITDRYHGTIFSLIANTPVIVVSSTDHKLSSGVKWFPESFKDYVYYSESIDNLDEIVKKVYQTELDYMLPTYFWDNYYKSLRLMLEE